MVKRLLPNSWLVLLSVTILGSRIVLYSSHMFASVLTGLEQLVQEGWRSMKMPKALQARWLLQN